MARNTKNIAARVMTMTSSDWSMQSLMNMPERELRAIYSQQRDVERKRMASLEKAGYGESGILQRFDLAPKLSSLKTKREIAAELKEMHRFLGMQTSTVSGQKVAARHFHQAMEDIAGKPLSAAEADQLAKLMSKVSAAIKDKVAKYQAVSAMMNFAQSKGIKNPDKFFKDVDFWKANIDKLAEISKITTPTGRASQSSEAYKRAIRFYNKLSDFTGE